MRHIDLPEVFRGRDAIEAGLLTPGALRGPTVRRLFTGVYAPRSVTVDHELRCRAAALLGEGQLVLTGRSAATVHGVPLASRADDVEVIALRGARVNRRPGLQVRRVRIADADHRPWREIEIATPERLAFDVMADGELTRAVSATDRLLRAGTVTREVLSRYLEGRHDHGVVQARQVLELADARAESPPESVVRVVLALAGLVADPQHVVLDAGGFVARVDLAFTELRLAVEYDGRWHAERDAFTADRERLNRLQSAGREVLTITAEMLRTPHRVVDLVRAAVERRRRELRR